MNMKKIFCVFYFTTLAFTLNADENIRNSTQWWGTYECVVPQSRGTGKIEVFLTLNRDYTYRLSIELFNLTGVGPDGMPWMTLMATWPEITTGNFHWDSAGKVITLENALHMYTFESNEVEYLPMVFEVGKSFVRRLDTNRNRVNYFSRLYQIILYKQQTEMD
jgi:hypothetical protein